MTGFVEVARDVFVLRYPVLDVNVSLILGADRAVVVDTLSTDAQATELHEAVRRVTTAPLTVVNTHHHFDHCFGNAIFSADGCPIYAHEEAAVALRLRGEQLQREWYAQMRATEPVLAEELATVTICPPDHAVRVESSIDVGGRTIMLRYLGRGHTAGDLLVFVPDTDAVVAGDLIEQGAPPQFDDAYPLDWPDTVAALLAGSGPDTIVVPGHGAVVDRPFVLAQHEQLAALAWLIREGGADGAPADAVAARSPFGAEGSLVAVRRGYDQLAGKG